MRTKEAIATVKGYVKFQAQGENGDPFAKGILAAIRWMTEKDSPPPYASLVEDLDDSGGWEGQQKVDNFIPAPMRPTLVVALEDKNLIQGHQPQHVPLYDPSNPPPLDEAPRLVLPDSMSSHLTQHPWLQPYLDDISALQQSHGGAPVMDNNSVIVGQGLRDSPVLGGDGEDY